VVALTALVAIAFGDTVEAAVGVRGVGVEFVVVGLANLHAKARAGYRNSVASSD